MLPPVDRLLLLFEQWLPGWLDTIPDPDHRQVLRQFAAWHILRHLRSTAEYTPIGPYRNVNARRVLHGAATFLTDLADRAEGWPTAPRPTWSVGTQPLAAANRTSCARPWRGPFDAASPASHSLRADRPPGW